LSIIPSTTIIFNRNLEYFARTYCLNYKLAICRFKYNYLPESNRYLYAFSLALESIYTTGLPRIQHWRSGRNDN